MAAKEKSKRKKKRPSTRTTDPVQSARFLEMAKCLEVDESGARFQRALDLLVPKDPKK